MTEPNDVKARLIERLSELTGPDREVDYRLQNFFEHGVRAIGWRPLHGDYKRGARENGAPQFTSSLDAVLALVERKLPGFAYALGSGGEEDLPWACLTAPEEPFQDFAATAITTQSALLIALLKALPEGEV